MRRNLGILALLLLTLGIDARAQTNILVYDQQPGRYAPCEPSIAINPSNTAEIIAGAVLDYMFVSRNHGRSWEMYTLESPLGVYGDPCVIADNQNQFYYFHLSDPSGEGWESEEMLDRIVVHTRKGRRNRWNKGKSIGHNPPKDQDKEWAAYDPYNERLVVTWTQFDEYGSTEPGCESNILMSTSKNGSKWSKPIQLNTTPGNCEDDSQTAEGAVPAVDAYGNVLTAWGRDGSIWFQTVPSVKNVNIQPEKELVKNALWSFDVPGLSRANGMPITAADRSPTATRGNAYICWSDQRNGTDDTDVWLIRSSDGGFNWDEPIQVNDDGPGKHQFLPWMTVDQSSGFIYIVFYDRRNHDDNKTDVYMAVSKDGGETFKNHLISQDPFEPSGDVFFGDYINIDAVKGNVRPIWTREDKGKLSIWTAIISQLTLEEMERELEGKTSE